MQVGEGEHWEALMREHHYLGYRSLIGETLRYVSEEEGQWVGLLSWSTAAFNCGVRYRWIGWSKSQQWRRLRHVAHNSRLLVLPQTRRKNVASQLLAANLRRVGGLGGAPRASGAAGGDLRGPAVPGQLLPGRGLAAARANPGVWAQRG